MLAGYDEAGYPHVYTNAIGVMLTQLMLLLIYASELFYFLVLK